MDVCANCGEKVSGSSRFCPNCSTMGKTAKNNMTSVPTTRVEKMKMRSNTIELRNKRVRAAGGSVIGILLVLLVAFFIMKDFNKPEAKTDAAAVKTITATKKSNHVEKTVKPNNNTKSTEQTSSKSSTPSASDYILPDSDKSVLTKAAIATLSKGQLRLARNEIYARHGYVFKSADLQAYFSSKSWYKADPSYKGAINQIEQANVNLLKAREDQL